jgi:hypothetical protein
VRSLGAIVAPFEAAFGVAWSLGEVGLALARVHHVLSDPHREALRADVARRGFHPAIDPDALDLRLTGNIIRGTNPYRRVSGARSDRVLAHLRRAKRNPRRRLLVVFHCYGLPSPTLMHRLFGLEGVEADVVTNVMAHHQLGTYPFWPGSGFVSARLSHFLENLRSAITGARAVVRWLREREGYASVVVAGFSIGGHLALHLAHAGEVDGALLYCPVTAMHVTARELGMMRVLAPLFDPVLRRMQGATLGELFAIADPLGLPLGIPEARLHVIVQRYDALSPVHQTRPILEKYPGARWTELDGTHLLPLGREVVRRSVRDLLSS